MARMAFGIEGKPIAWVTKAEVMIHLCTRMPGQQFRRRILGPRHAHIAFGHGKPTRQHFRHTPVKFAEQRRLPAIPNL